jgi:hypothetical protein
MSTRSFTAGAAELRLLCPPGGVGQGLSDVLGFQVGILAKNLVPRAPSSDEADVVPTVTRMPRMQGFPPITLGS